MRLIVEERDSFPLARVVFGFQCQECGEEYRIGLNGSDHRRLRPKVVAGMDETVIRAEAIACSKCGSTGSVSFTAERAPSDWDAPETS